VLRFFLNPDWALIIRLSTGALFLWAAMKFQDWLPAIFGFALIIIGAIGAYNKRGCGYDDNCNI
jgi:hypothetical protein